jgi:chromosome segregation ATPase
MLSLDQVRLLENRVVKAVGKIESLTAENTRLKTQLSGLQSRVGELEALVRSFRDDQGRIEEGILNALDRLSAFEDSILSGPEPASAPQEQTPANSTREPVFAPDNAEIDTESVQPSSHDISVEAEWDSSEEEPKTAVSEDNGQMDIF